MSDENRIKIHVRAEDHIKNVCANYPRQIRQKYYCDSYVSAEEKEIATHSVVLSACSPYLKHYCNMGRDIPPIFIFRGISYTDLLAIVQFMYYGEMFIEDSQVDTILRAAAIIKFESMYKSIAYTTWNMNPTSNELRPRNCEHSDDGNSSDDSDSDDCKENKEPPKQSDVALPPKRLCLSLQKKKLKYRKGKMAVNKKGSGTSKMKPII